MKRVYVIAGLTCLGVVAALVWLDYLKTIELLKLYPEKLQTPLFSGFLTLGSFLLSLKTFILLRLKQDVYDSPHYAQHIRESRAFEPDLPYYGGLRQLSELLVASVICALTTSVFQLTLGFWRRVYPMAVCAGMAAFTLVLVFFCWWQIKENLKLWLAHAEKEKAKVKPGDGTKPPV